MRCTLQALSLRQLVVWINLIEEGFEKRRSGVGGQMTAVVTCVGAVGADAPQK
jgi:hypothetical protein